MTAMWRPKNWPIKRPRIGHVMPYIRGDSIRVLKFVFRVLGLPWVDQNTQCTVDGWALVVHWDVMQKNGYEWRWTGEYVRRYGRRVEHRVRVARKFRVHEHTLEKALTFREKQYGGRRPRRVEAHWRVIAALRGKVMQEVKGSPGFALPLVWERMRVAALATGVHVVFATLTDLPGWKQRVDQALAVGAPIAVLARDMTAAERQWCHDRGVAIW